MAFVRIPPPVVNAMQYSRLDTLRDTNGAPSFPASDLHTRPLLRRVLRQPADIGGDLRVAPILVKGGTIILVEVIEPARDVAPNGPRQIRCRPERKRLLVGSAPRVLTEPDAFGVDGGV